MEALEKTTVIFTIVLASSLLVERLLEVLKTIVNYIDSKYDWYSKWTNKTLRLRDKIERRLHVFEYVDPKQMAKYLQRFKGLFMENVDEQITHVPMLSGDFVRAFYYKIYFKILAVFLGIGLAFWFNLDILSIWVKYSEQKINIPEGAIRVLLTGITIGLGSGPVHKIITSIEKQKEKRETKNNKS